MDDDCQLLESKKNNDDDDPLVAEIDIYLSRVFADQLYLFQYPQIPRDLNFEERSKFVGVRLKPKNKVVELEAEIVRENEFFSENREKFVATNLSREPIENSTKVTMNRFLFSSSNATGGENHKRFSVGLVTPCGIELSPLNAIFQIRPDFDLTSSNVVRTKISSDDEESEAESTNKIENSPPIEDEKNYNLVTMKYFRPELRREKERKLRSFDYFQRARQEERWIELAYRTSDELESIELRQKWKFHKNSNFLHRFPVRWRKTISIDEYLTLLLMLPGHQQIALEDQPQRTSIDSNPPTEQKQNSLENNKPKKKIKNQKEKSKKTRTSHQLAPTNNSTNNVEQKPIQNNVTPLSSISLPQTIVKADPETIQNELLSFIKRRFAYRPYFKLSEINTAIKLDLISSPPGHPLATGVTEASILRAAAEIGAIFVNKKWPKNLKQEPVFINTQMGDKYDILRRYVADLLERSDGFQFSELRLRIKQENQTQNFPVVELKKFVKDHFITRSSRKGVLYCVKGTALKQT